MRKLLLERAWWIITRWVHVLWRQWWELCCLSPQNTHSKAKFVLRIHRSDLCEKDVQRVKLTAHCTVLEESDSGLPHHQSKLTLGLKETRLMYLGPSLVSDSLNLKNMNCQTGAKPSNQKQEDDIGCFCIVLLAFREWIELSRWSSPFWCDEIVTQPSFEPYSPLDYIHRLNDEGGLVIIERIVLFHRRFC